MERIASPEKEVLNMKLLKVEVQRRSSSSSPNIYLHATISDDTFVKMDENLPVELLSESGKRDERQVALIVERDKNGNVKVVFDKYAGRSAKSLGIAKLSDVPNLREEALRVAREFWSRFSLRPEQLSQTVGYEVKNEKEFHILLNKFEYGDKVLSGSVSYEVRNVGTPEEHIAVPPYSYSHRVFEGDTTVTTGQSRISNTGCELLGNDLLPLAKAFFANHKKTLFVEARRKSIQFLLKNEREARERAEWDIKHADENIATLEAELSSLGK
jgi:hypothetical protein